MRRRAKTSYIQPDARGRIQLPRELREFPLFKLGEKNGAYELTPVRLVEEKKQTNGDSVWLTPEVNQYLKEVIFLKLRQFAEDQHSSGVTAVFLYGSRARGDALSKSDFDFGLLCKQYPKGSKRHEFLDAWSSLLHDEFAELANHGIEAEPTFHFFSSEFEPSSIPPIYYSIASDGIVIWQEVGAWNKFLLKINHAMKAKKVRSQGRNKNRSWIWESE